ncbi:MAG: alkaline phosphatase family protein, partial [Myxococcota bacterium]|nr:alkaline phosphatase family protein [Myxococcota bacterium]
LSTHPYARDEYAVRIAVRAIEKKKPEVMAVYLKGVDELSHLFWQFKDRQFRRSMKQRPHDYAAASAANPVLRMPWSGESMTEGKLELGGEVVDRYLEWVDKAIGRILDAAGGNPDVIVMSDHGFTSMAREGGLTSPEHRLMGTLILHGPSFDPDAVLMAPSMLDITPTLLHMRRLPVGEDMVGRPLVEALEDQRPVDWIHTYEDSPIYRADVEDQDESFEYDRLRALGYVE